MTFWIVLIVLYAVIANLAMYMTCREHAQDGRRSIRWTLIGVTACALWPLVVVAMMVQARMSGRAAA